MYSKGKLMFIAARPFALPWVAVNTLLGISLAGFHLMQWFVAFVIVGLVLTASHYINNWRDYVRGFDAIENGSTGKSYTLASKLLPAGLLSTADMIHGALVMLGLSAMLMLLYAPHRLDVWGLYALGVFLALTYTDVFKPKGFGEIALFLGHGWSTTTFAYAIVKPVGIDGFVAGILLGMLAALAYTLDQLPDVETDFGKKARDLAYIMFKAEIRPSSYVWFTASAISFLTVAFVLLGWLPKEMLLGLLSMPLFHITGVVIDYDYGKGMLIGLGAIWTFPLLAAIGLII